MYLPMMPEGIMLESLSIDQLQNAISTAKTLKTFINDVLKRILDQIRNVASRSASLALGNSTNAFIDQSDFQVNRAIGHFEHVHSAAIEIAEGKRNFIKKLFSSKVKAYEDAYKASVVIAECHVYLATTPGA